MKKITVKSGANLDDYKAYGSLFIMVDKFLQETEAFPEKLKGRTIWMINSTAIGGGVAEMLPSQMRIMRTLGIKIEWLVIEATENAFFNLTKRIHNAIHGSGSGVFTEEDREVYERVNTQNVEKALEYIADGDIVVIHDPQPMPLARMIRAKRKVKTVWRCHIGLESTNETTEGVWDFLSVYYPDYDHFVFSLPSYVPESLKNKTAIIPPAIDPLSHKNRMLWMSKCLGILQQSGVIREQLPMLYPNYQHQVRRVMPDGSFNKVNHDSELDIIFHPTVLQISRWDRLKGFKELMEAFILMKKENEKKADKSSMAYRRIRHTRLALGGPDPAFVSDDPEGMEVLNELIEQYKGLSVDLQRSIALLLLPLDNPKENALIVNALQRSATIVVQNSIQEGFGLTATEAMWKKRPVLVSGAAGLRAQVQHNINGKINPDPSDIKKLAQALEDMLSNPLERDKWGFNGQVRVINKFTLFSQIKSWLDLLSTLY
ncbi:MAG: glycosyltransferase [Eudoraea sp.]|nr:glycosyltransferase [Eudoraea sp.]MBT8322851.1 glycosyltransferase [Eudoraea sp.]NNJ39301.1 glycosyltransferase [Eudoraea sp.]